MEVRGMRMKNILVSMKVTDAHRDQFAAAADGASLIFSTAPSQEQIDRAQIIVGNVGLESLLRAQNLEMLQLQTAGVGAYEQLCAPGRNVRVCTASGAYGLAISEHMFGLLLGLQKRLFAYRDQQFSGTWKDLGEVPSVSDANVLVVGLGDIGGEFARRCRAFGAHVTGIRRSPGPCPEFCDAVGVQADLDRWLPDADVVFLCVPETRSTIGLMDRTRIFKMKRGAILLNAGRGSAVDTAALMDALKEGHLWGAGLDVTAPEPLPSDHPLWKCPNVIITPHISGGLHLKQTHDRIVRIACENIRACLSGGALTNAVEYERGY